MTIYNTVDYPEFMRQQYVFAAHIRNPESNPCPEAVEERRMKIYCELFYNNVESFIANSFPVLRQIIPDKQWHAMIRDYFANHLSHTPLFPEMPREFLKYLEQERMAQPDDPPFILELAHYEWVELALSILDEQAGEEKTIPESEFLDAIPAISPLAWPLNYHFPVHKINPDFQPHVPGAMQTHLIVYRDAGFEVHFMEINLVTARLLQLISSNEHKSVRILLQQIAIELNHVQPDIVIRGGMEVLDDLRKRQVILGS
ncbi:HvfC family RiPP maturation protein [Nitrosomonas ureae]|uniref:Uncharacterized protein n=1 Tax=Nitrosomonas ureae TaxID=44577 RepID=A0A1H5RKI6_9PROT|nr:putative DNA-binding domain-containing protein [Nitrosomonas ureae]SEF38780.1 hypothetical protein SAMN05216334_10137 [Nitrosomonas ureae]